MRFALSAMAATSGVVLLSLAVFGDPAAYLRRAADEWRNAVATPPAVQIVPVARPDNTVAPASVTALQEEVTRLKEQLAARQAVHAAPPPAAVEAPPPAAEPPPPDARPEQAPARTAVDAPATAPAPASEQPAPAPAQAASAATVPAPVPKAPPPAATEAESLKPRRASPPHQDVALPRPEPVPPRPVLPRPLPAPPRADPDDARSVLARLRQTVPLRDPPGTVTAMAERPGPLPQAPLPVPAPLPAPPPPAVASPALAGLIGARAALASGRIEEARRKLQQAQLALVFRPLGSDNVQAAAAANSAADVARALEALSINDPARARRFADRALDDLSGAPPRAPEPPAGNLAAGYAPAYPPR